MLQQGRTHADPSGPLAMHDAPRTDTEMYRFGLQRADAELQDQLTAIRAAEDGGDISVREAADKRIGAMEAHLKECRRLRQRYLS
ncbi:MAG: hypothetical protein J2P28_02925 [Actinobacteria bacterium]|nr:hypothetical protein [Actinomycetota bacterium]MBO0834457.1 hypothetical protein [Actinomycetota bacterium]